MTYKEALKDMCTYCSLYPCHALKNKEHCQSYNILNKINELQIPKKPIITKYHQGAVMLPDLDEAQCPNCKTRNIGDDEYRWKFCHCIACGQAIDWSEEE